MEKEIRDQFYDFFFGLTSIMKEMILNDMIGEGDDK